MQKPLDLMAALVAADACSEAREWLAAERLREPTATDEAHWLACPRGDWLLWLAVKAGVDRRLIVLAACQCARLVLDRIPPGEDRPRLAIETAEAWARGEATIEQVREAGGASAYAAAYASAAYAAAAAVYAAAHAAAHAAAYAAVYAAADAAAAYAAADAADADAYAAASASARSAMLASCADAVRAVIPWADVERGLYLSLRGSSRAGSPRRTRPS